MFARYLQPAAPEVRVSKFIRIFHRWMSIVFTLIVGAIFLMLGLGPQPAQWFYYLPLLPLFLLMVTGLYMFFQPYVDRARRGRAS